MHSLARHMDQRGDNLEIRKLQSERMECIEGRKGVTLIQYRATRPHRWIIEVSSRGAREVSCRIEVNNPEAFQVGHVNTHCL